MTLNCAKLGSTVSCMKNHASVVSLIFLPNTLTRNKIASRLSNLLNLEELVVNELMKSILKKVISIFFLSDLSLLVVKISGAYN